MPRPRSDIRLRLIEAARLCFLAYGVDGASLRAIARLARTNVGMVVYYFPTKDALFFAVLDDGYAVLIADLARVKRRTRLAACSPKEREVMRLVAREALSAAPKRRRALDRFFRTRVKSFNGLPDPDELARVATELLLA